MCRFLLHQTYAAVHLPTWWRRRSTKKRVSRLTYLWWSESHQMAVRNVSPAALATHFASSSASWAAQMAPVTVPPTAKRVAASKRTLTAAFRTTRPPGPATTRATRHLPMLTTTSTTGCWTRLMWVTPAAETRRCLPSPSWRIPPLAAANMLPRLRRQLPRNELPLRRRHQWGGCLSPMAPRRWTAITDPRSGMMTSRSLEMGAAVMGAVANVAHLRRSITWVKIHMRAVFMARRRSTMGRSHFDGNTKMGTLQTMRRRVSSKYFLHIPVLHSCLWEFLKCNYLFCVGYELEPYNIVLSESLFL